MKPRLTSVGVVGLVLAVALYLAGGLSVARFVELRGPVLTAPPNVTVLVQNQVLPDSGREGFFQLARFEPPYDLLISLSLPEDSPVRSVELSRLRVTAGATELVAIESLVLPPQVCQSYQADVWTTVRCFDFERRKFLAESPPQLAISGEIILTSPTETIRFDLSQTFTLHRRWCVSLIGDPVCFGGPVSA